jgi:hypothetical protein
MTKDRRNRRHQDSLPATIPLAEGERLVKVYVEGYDDVAFWRGIFNDFETELLTFEIAVPPRSDLAKGKKVVMDMIEGSSPELLLCVDSDFDYLFNGLTSQSKKLLSSPYLFHTYTYSTENYLCFAPALHTVCTKATKNDTRIFDFERFLEEYSRIVYPVFLWYAYSARLGSEHIFTLVEFKNCVRINYLDVPDNGQSTLAWVARNVQRKLHTLNETYEDWRGEVTDFGHAMEKLDLYPDNTYLFMHGHTLMDNVVMPALSAVCESLKQLATHNISQSTQRGIALGNEVNNYRNAILNVRDTLIYNEEYKGSFLYRRLHADIRTMLQREELLYNEVSGSGSVKRAR